ncbi:hypothetical protein P4S72_04480 [Vibrio sp. PP-XX7]
MKYVILIGTSHSTQRNLERTEFSDYVESIANQYGVKAIAEEIDESPSVVQRLSKYLNVKYINIEPSMNEREELGINRFPGLIDLAVYQEFGNVESKGAHNEIERRMQSDCRKRENEWLRRIDNLGVFPILVVCGANHVEPFSLLLRNNDYSVDIACTLKE